MRTYAHARVIRATSSTPHPTQPTSPHPTLGAPLCALRATHCTLRATLRNTRHARYAMHHATHHALPPATSPHPPTHPSAYLCELCPIDVVGLLVVVRGELRVAFPLRRQRVQGYTHFLLFIYPLFLSTSLLYHVNVGKVRGGRVGERWWCAGRSGGLTGSRNAKREVNIIFINNKS
jgi:hypothetical protein